MQGIKTVIHIAEINYSENLVKTGEKMGVAWFILVHTTGRFSVFKSASAEYIRIEDALIESYKNLTILRPTMIYGSSSDKNIWRPVNFLYKFKFFPVFGTGENLMQPVVAMGPGDAYIKVLINKEKTINKQYDLSGKEPLPYIDLLKTVSRKLNRRTVFIHFPISLCILGAKIYNFLLPKKAIFSVEQVMRMNEDKAFSYEEASKDFGFAPLSFEDGINSEIEEYINSTQ